MRRLQAIQWLRGIAALAVVLQHWEVTSQKYGLSRLMTPAEPVLRAGVDLFFVISGFVMFYTTRDTSSKLASVREFWTRRLIRIVPLYYIFTTLVVVVAVTNTHVTEYSFSGLHALASYLFIPAIDATGNVQPPLRVGWSLNYEMYFYVVFGLALLAPRRWLPASIIGWAVVSVVVGLVTTPNQPALALITSELLLEFCVGVVVGWTYVRCERLRVPFALGWVVVAVAAAGCAETYAPGLPRIAKFGLPMAVLLVALLSVERSSPRVFENRIALLLGDTSYALYLTHVLSMASFGLMVRHWHLVAMLPSGLLFVAGVIVAVVSAVGVHLVIEQPLQRWLLRRRSTG